jgi:hypothetical protein
MDDHMSIGTYFGEVAQKRKKQDRQAKGNRTFYRWAKNKERCDVFVSKEPGFDYKLALTACLGLGWSTGDAAENACSNSRELADAVLGD